MSCTNRQKNINCECQNQYCPSNLSQKEMLHEIMSLNFAINDLALYLNTHPQDTDAIKMHNEYSKKQIFLTEEYQRLYGPLTISFISNTWDWIDDPWPWERGAY